MYMVIIFCFLFFCYQSKRVALSESQSVYYFAHLEQTDVAIMFPSIFY